MILKEQVLRAGAFWAMPWRSVDEFQIVVNHNSIVANGGSSVGSLLAIRIVLGRLEFDIVCLPCQWWEAHVDFGLVDRIDPTAFVVFPIQAE